MSYALAIPAIARRRAESLGTEGRAWLLGLDGEVATLERDWGFSTGRVLDGGSEALVAEVVRADGTPAVLKVSLPSASADQARFLEAAGGRGYAQLYARDPARRAMLMERLGRRLGDARLPVASYMRILCGTLEQAWMPAPVDGGGFVNGAEKAASMATFITGLWEELGRPVAEQVIDRALEFCERRRTAFDIERCVLGHGDCHEYNALEAPDSPSGYRFIDPDGMVIEPAYDLAIQMRGWSAELLAGDAVALGHARARFLHSLTGVDPTPIWEWGYIERVGTGLLLQQLGAEAEAAEYLAVAQQWALDRQGP